MKQSKPFFYDVTLRDGNQALKRPWNVDEKVAIFRRIANLGVSGVEAGFASASETDFESCKLISKIASDSITISSLSRAVESEIEISWNAIKNAAKPRLHIVYPVSKFTIENMLKKSYDEVKQNVIRTVRYAKSLVGNKGTVQFSGEHFGDSMENIEFAVEVFKAAIDSGADVINLPNTVERYRPLLFVKMIADVVRELSNYDTIISIHTHNDLGMATATTVESYFVGATQLETALNGLGERAGNTNFYEVAVALHNCGIQTGINYEAFYDTANYIAKMSGIPIHEKAPLIGEDVFAHRSGIHQDGVAKTIHLEKNAYGAIQPSFIGRKDSHKISFTSQSGRGAIKHILSSKGIIFTDSMIDKLQKELKKVSEEGLDSIEETQIVKIFQNLDESKQLTGSI
jgi:2-isopropylmalate synthase